ncbi:hypothetical protein SM11_chr1800 [Sinorhizobium meliloti SM11]|uniref:Uncharacterized protein n=1 Tax=Sinorhizobium meliloti (strain SM11) TaxID=707241 RepID=F7X9G0_SINMM|nr:hypothetical protein SM11_chr1800 [Sinorhizobium meliloti SM11]
MIGIWSSSSIDAARHLQSRELQKLPHHACDRCDRVLSVDETIERFCERCDHSTNPSEKKDAAA